MKKFIFVFAILVGVGLWLSIQYNIKPTELANHPFDTAKHFLRNAFANVGEAGSSTNVVASTTDDDSFVDEESTSDNKDTITDQLSSTTSAGKISVTADNSFNNINDSETNTSFLNKLIALRQSEIDAAKIALVTSRNPDVIKTANDIIVANTKVIQALQTTLKKLKN